MPRVDGTQKRETLQKSNKIQQRLCQQNYSQLAPKIGVLPACISDPTIRETYLPFKSFKHEVGGWKV
jgi:hypothetical protein